MHDRHRLKTDLLALGLLAATFFVALSLLSHDPADPPSTAVYPPRAAIANTCGRVGAWVAHTLYTAFGAGAWSVLVAMAVVDVRLFSRKFEHDPLVRGFGWALLIVSTSVGCRAAFTLNGGTIYGSGGYIGAWGVSVLEEHFSQAGTALIILTALAVSLLLTTDTFLIRALAYLITAPYTLFYWLSFGKRVVVAAAAAIPAEPFRVRETTPDTLPDLTINPPPGHVPETVPLADGPEPAATEETLPLAETSLAVSDPEHRQAIKINPPVGAAPKAAPKQKLYPLPVLDVPKKVELPTSELLEEPEPFPFEVLAEKARGAAVILEKTFKEFGLNVRVVEIDTGPVITQYELELEAGLRLNKVTALADDLAIALRVPSVRVVAPIPGKNTVGVEVPNEKQVMVRLRELIEACPEAMEKKRIPVYLGKDVSGRPLVVDLAKMPHLLIAGRTGTGKSVCLNALILSILMSRTPDQVKMLMIDPKMVELSPYKRVPHLMHPVITDMKKAEAVLAWAVDKMEERYDLLARCGVRHLDNYNEMGREQIFHKLGIDPDSEEATQVPEKMPYIVIIADEMADMMMTSGKDVEGHIIRLAQKSRAVGIHLVLATQKPTVDVITGLIKSNLPARIAFQVASRVDSRVVLDEMGADRLLGNGDMLYLMPGTSKITRAQGTYVSDAEVNTIIDFYGDCEPQYSRELAQLSTKSAGKSGIEAIRSRDELYEQAIDVVVREGRGSTSLLQRALGIGYGRAARLIDYMAEDGIVGDYNGSQAREVMYTPEQWAEIVAGREMESVEA
ncbi:MAG: DNA translocase FtsK [Planctomycetes bacterium]|nr:DNA translocase FtsK [Planctomycetota bacterium]